MASEEAPVVTDRQSSAAAEAAARAGRAVPAVVVVMGVSGAGKTTVGTLLAERLDWPFRDADSFHPPANVEKMRSGTPLTDDDRKPWLEAIAAWIDEIRKDGRHGVVTCSALKRRYRAVIVGDRPDVRLVYLKGDKALIARRLAARRHHFMPASLLDSQFAALEEPGPDEHAIAVSIDASPADIVTAILKAIAQADARVAG